MDIQALIETAKHNPILVFLAGSACGFATAHMPMIVRNIIASKPVTSLIRKDPALAKAIAAEILKDVTVVADTPYLSVEHSIPEQK